MLGQLRQAFNRLHRMHVGGGTIKTQLCEKYAAVVAELKISAKKQAQLKNKIKSPHRSKLFNREEIALHVLLKNEIKPPSCSIS